MYLTEFCCKTIQYFQLMQYEIDLFFYVMQHILNKNVH